MRDDGQHDVEEHRRHLLRRGRVAQPQAGRSQPASNSGPAAPPSRADRGRAGVSSLCLVGAVALWIVSLVTYAKQPDATKVGFQRFVYGEYRRTRPVLFWGAVLCGVAGFVGMLAVSQLAAR